MDAPDPNKAVADFYAGRREAQAPTELSKGLETLAQYGEQEAAKVAEKRALLEGMALQEHQLRKDNSALQAFLHEHFEDQLEDESAIQAAIRLLKESKELPLSKDWMETQSYRRFEPTGENPDYSIRDMVWGCARMCRFAGQIREEHEHYSVAEHLVLLFDYYMTQWDKKTALAIQDAVERQNWNFYALRFMRTLVTHDLQEGLIGDMVRPMKRQDPIYRRIEDRLSAHMAKRWSLVFPLPREVKFLDNSILVDERAQAVGISSNDWGSIEGMEPLGVELKFWSPRKAAQELFQRLEEVGFDINE